MGSRFAALQSCSTAVFVCSVQIMVAAGTICVFHVGGCNETAVCGNGHASVPRWALIMITILGLVASLSVFNCHCWRSCSMSSDWPRKTQCCVLALIDIRSVRFSTMAAALNFQGIETTRNQQSSAPRESRWEFFIGDRPHVLATDAGGSRQPMVQLAAADRIVQSGELRWISALSDSCSSSSVHGY